MTAAKGGTGLIRPRHKEKLRNERGESSMSNMVMVEKWKVEVLKVYYAIFTALIDGQNEVPAMSDAELLSKLRQLSARLKNEVSDHGTLN